MVESTAEKIVLLIDKIERSLELQAAQVLQTGIITVADGSNIDFKRKSQSLVDGSATPWTGAYDPNAQIAEGIKFLRTVGKAKGGIFHVIMGSAAADAYFANAKVLARGPLSNINFDNLRAPQQNATGAADHGVITAGSYKANLWTYPQFYEDADGNQQEYIHPKKIIIIPENPNFVMGFGAVPQLIDMKNPRIVKGAFVLGDYPDQRNHAHIHDVRSAGVAIPVAVDQIYTRQVVA